MSNKVALLFGYGPHVGVDVADAFKAKGYQVAVVSRSKKHIDRAKDLLFIQADLTDPKSVVKAFTTVIDEYGHPSVVIFNAGASSVNASTQIDQQIADLTADINVNVTSAYVASQLAIQSFSKLSSDASKTFIYTGNKLNLIIVPPLLSAGIGKAGTAHMIQYLAEQHRDQGYKFYFADEREPSADPVFTGIDGPAHGQFYTQLAEKESQGPWLATFIKGQGYVDFGEITVKGRGYITFEEAASRRPDMIHRVDRK